MSNLFSPNKFLSELNGRGGPAKNSLYNVQIYKPGIFVPGGILSPSGPTGYTLVKDEFKSLSYLCESTEMPGKSFVTEKVKIYGPGYNVPYLTTYQNISLTFLCTNAHTERELFDLWMNSIINPNTNNVRFPKGNNSEYLSHIDIIQYDSREKEIYKVQLIDAFPASIAPQQLSWSDDGFQRLNVSFLYQKYELGILN
jgi:hypothetical protein